MSDDDDTSHASSAAAPAAREGWSVEDRRTMFITIVGGLVANLGAVILVGAALAFVHLEKHYRLSTWELLLGALCTAVVGIFWYILTPARGDRASGPWVRWMGLGGALLILLEAALILIGLAAGVK